MTDVQRSLVLVKPDGVRRGLSGEVLRRIEAKGYTLAAVELRTATPEILAEHYVHRSESELVKSTIKERGRHRIIDKVTVTLEIEALKQA